MNKTGSLYKAATFLWHTPPPSLLGASCRGLVSENKNTHTLTRTRHFFNKNNNNKTAHGTYFVQNPDINFYVMLTVFLFFFSPGNQDLWHNIAISSKTSVFVFLSRGSWPFFFFFFLVRDDPCAFFFSLSSGMTLTRFFLFSLSSGMNLMRRVPQVIAGSQCFCAVKQRYRINPRPKSNGKRKKN